MHLSRNDADSTKTVAVGDHITVTLSERPTTGYRWRAEFDPEIMRLVDDHYDGPTTPMGAAGTRTIIFEVTTAAPSTLRLTQGRSWEQSSSDEFTIHLKPA
jgi:predicted secreted protein